MTVKRSGSFYPQRHPFWLPAISYYFLTLAIAFIVFFLIWGLLHEGGDQTPWIPAGVLSSVILICAVFLREIFLRNARKRYVEAKRQLDYNLSKLPKISSQRQKHRKFTLQQNSSMLNHIKEKSDAASVLKRLPDAHLGVFEICNEYLIFTNRELKWIDKNSPRYLAVKKGRRKVRHTHKYHLLKWAEVETKKYTLEAKNQTTVVKKVEFAQKALTVLNSALKYYQKDAKLVESYEAITEFISTIKITNLIETADKMAFRGQNKEAIDQYNDILFLLTRENLNLRDKYILTEKVESEIQKLYRLEDAERTIDYQPDIIKKIKND